MKNKTLLALVLVFFFCISATAQVVVPKKIIGNWISEKTNDWDYGFHEQFAIYNTDFWEYASIEEDKKMTSVVLRKGSETVSLKISARSRDRACVVTGDNKPVWYKKSKQGYAAYPEADHTPFKHSGFKSDTVTMLGYYRNYQSFMDSNHDKQVTGEFKVGVYNILLNKTINYTAPIDSLGRFMIKFPVLNTQEIYTDWGRLTKQFVVEPGEKLFVFADLEDFIVVGGETTLDRNYRNRPKHVLFMGANGRVTNEIANYYIPASRYFEREQILRDNPPSSDMEFLKLANRHYEAGMKHLQEYIQTHPTVSDRFKEYQSAFEKYDILAIHLMQYRKYIKMERKRISFEPGYMEFVNKNIPLDNEQHFTLIREGGRFIYEYKDYHRDVVDKLVYDENSKRWRSSIKRFSFMDEMMKVLKSSEVVNEEGKKLIAKIEELQAGLPENKKWSILSAEHKELRQQWMALQQDPEVEKLLIDWSKNIKFNHTSLLDSLFENRNLKDLLLASALCQRLDRDQAPLKDFDFQSMEETICNADIKANVKDLNKYYIEMTAQPVKYEASLKNTEHLKDMNDADAIFEALIKPYRGKVIYIDFWGTWCAPCRQQMPFAAALKKQLAGKDVIFMYLANYSPEPSWKNLIRQMDLTGENVVHYRLPDKQQRMIQEKFGVNKFPTYMLLDKTGKLVDDDAPRPQSKVLVIKEIDKLLNK